jgi:hypothetical protein
MDIYLDARAKHTDWISDPILAVDQKMLTDGMNDMILSGQINGLGILDDILNIVLRYFTIG